MNDYSLDWFRHKALHSIKRIDETTWDYSDPSLIYLPDAEEKYETIQQDSSRYHDIVTAPERAYVQRIAERIGRALPDNFDYIDLGPGTEHKEQYLFDALKVLGKRFRYIPVDVNKKYLDLAVAHAESQGIETLGVQAAFESVAGRLPLGKARFVSIGMTFSNYPPAVIFPLLKAISGRAGFALTNCQIRDRVDMETVADVYQKDVSTLLEPKLQLVGLTADDIEKQWCDDSIKAWFRIQNVSAELKAVGVKPYDTFLAYYFLRPTVRQLSEEIEPYFTRYELLDTGEAFVAALLEAE